MDTDEQKIRTEDQTIDPKLDPEKEKKREEFIERVEGAVRKEKRALVARETIMSVLSPATSIIAPAIGNHVGWLSAFILARQGSDFGGELKNLQETTDYRRLGNRLFLEFAREADETMPEVERDVKKSEMLRSSIRRVSNESVRYIRSKTAVIGGIAGITMALASSTIPTLLNAAALGAGGVLTSLATIGGITAASALASSLLVIPRLRARRKADAQFRQEEMKEWNNVERKGHTLLSNPALTKATSSFRKKLQTYGEAVKKEDGVLTRAMRAFMRIAASISIPSLAIAAGVGVACYLTGIRSPSSIGMVVMSASVLNNSLKRILNARASLKETSDSMYDHYQNFAHSKVYTLTYGNERAPENTDCIQVKNPYYQLRDGDPKSPNVGHRNPQPLIQSDGEVVFRPGINLLSGASGAGKSTLYRLLRHADDLTMGSISYGRMMDGTFQGVKTTDMPRDEAYKHISFAFQDIENDDQTALEIIQLGTDLDEEEIKTAAELIDLPLYQETEDGIKPKQFSSMSGGEKKRVLFLQALLSDKRILVFDEPTANVDETTALKMLDLLNNDSIDVNGVPTRRTIIYTTHNPDELRNFNLDNIVQAVDMAPTSDPKKIESFVEKFGIGVFRLPTEIRVYPCNTEQEREDYITMVRSRNPEDKLEAQKQRITAWQAIRAAMEAKRAQKRKQEMAQQKPEQTQQQTEAKELNVQLLQHLSGKNDTK